MGPRRPPESLPIPKSEDEMRNMGIGYEPLDVKLSRPQKTKRRGLLGPPERQATERFRRLEVGG